jgi:High potential iron-sulfur protein
MQILRTVVEEMRMIDIVDESRRGLLKNVALGIVLVPITMAPLRAANAADAPLVSADDPTAKALKYASDASKAADAKPGSTCANCKLYQGAVGAAQGGCQLFPGKSVKATGWCISWTAKA